MKQFKDTPYRRRKRRQDRIINWIIGVAIIGLFLLMILSVMFNFI